MVKEYWIRTCNNRQARFKNYSANIERTRFKIDETPDTVVACEIIEYLVRAPHVMLLNINDWLPLSGKLLITIPNGAQFSNPLHVKSQTLAYRCNVYERHFFICERT
jgi:hypothetical protein